MTGEADCTNAEILREAQIYACDRLSLSSVLSRVKQFYRLCSADSAELDRQGSNVILAANHVRVPELGVV